MFGANNYRLVMQLANCTERTAEGRTYRLSSVGEPTGSDVPLSDKTMTRSFHFSVNTHQLHYKCHLFNCFCDENHIQGQVWILQMLKFVACDVMTELSSSLTSQHIAAIVQTVRIFGSSHSVQTRTFICM
jgi:hypothetical protein